MLYYVKDQTPKLCLEIIKQNGEALQFVNEQTEELCLSAFLNNIESYNFIKEPTQEMAWMKARLMKNHHVTYRENRYFLAQETLDLEQSPYHVLEQLYLN